MRWFPASYRTGNTSSGGPPPSGICIDVAVMVGANKSASIAAVGTTIVLLFGCGGQPTADQARAGGQAPPVTASLTSAASGYVAAPPQTDPESQPPLPPGHTVPVDLTLLDRTVTIAPGIRYRAWTFNGSVLHFSWVAMYPGAFLYHCGTPLVLAPICNGMYGAIIKAGRMGRVFAVDAGPSHFSAFHVVGALFSRVLIDDNPA